MNLPSANPTLRWLAAAVAATVLLATLCVYLSFCLLFWQGQWQLVFKPSQAITTTPASAGLAYEEIQFDATEAGVLQLHGWWLPATASAGTLLLMHEGSGSLSDTVPQLEALHKLGLSIFAFDYRGFGKSVKLHPSEGSTYEDADAAWRYLTETRHVATGSIVLDGGGLGAAVAVELARRHPGMRAVILEQPRPPVLETLHWNKQTRLLPVRLLFHDRYDPSAALAALPAPKLFLYTTPASAPRYYDQAAQPKEKAWITAGYGDPSYVRCLRDFLSRYPVHH